MRAKVPGSNKSPRLIAHYQNVAAYAAAKALGRSPPEDRRLAPLDDSWATLHGR